MLVCLHRAVPMAEKGTAAYCFKPNYKRSELGAPGIASRRKDAARGSWPYY